MRNTLIGLTVLLAGCTASDLVAVESAIAANKVTIADYCMSSILPAAQSPLVQAALLAADALPYGSDFTLAVNATVATCNNLDTTSQSATTKAYLQQELPVILGLGKVAPPPAIAPAPVTAASVAVSP